MKSNPIYTIILLLLTTFGFAQNNEITGTLTLPTVNSITPIASNGKVLTLDNSGKVILANTSSGTGNATNVYTIKSINSPAILGANITVDNTNTFLNDAINAAINLNYKKIYIQEGNYKMNGSVILSNKKGITIEGSGNSTIITPFTNMDMGLAFFKVENNSYYNTIKNLCLVPEVFNGQVSTAKINSCIELKDGDKNIFENILIGQVNNDEGVVNSYYCMTSPTPIHIIAQGEADFNTFRNISFKRSLGGIVINTSQGAFNGNTFENISFDKATVGIEFVDSDPADLSFRPNDNIFNKIKFQTTTNPSSDLVLIDQLTTHVVKNVIGRNNTFRDFDIFDWKESSPNNKLTYVINVSENADRTVIENFDIEGVTNNGISGVRVKYYKDKGHHTQFINNGIGLDGTDNILRGINDYYIEGVERTTYPTSLNDTDKNHLAFKNFGKVLIQNNLLNYVNSTFSLNNYNHIVIGNKSNNPNDTTLNNVASSTTINGNLKFQKDNGMSLTGVNVITNADPWGTMQWVPLTQSNVTIQSNLYNADGTITTGRTINQLTNSLTFKTFVETSPSVETLTIKKGQVYVGVVPVSTTSITENAGYKLLVNGKVKVKDEILVSNVGWADYVFKNDYKLQSLAEVESFIKQNGHLPNMPSAHEIETNGLPLASISTKQQEKIEELTLYLINQKKEIDELKKLVQQLVANTPQR